MQVARRHRSIRNKSKHSRPPGASKWPLLLSSHTLEIKQKKHTFLYSPSIASPQHNKPFFTASAILHRFILVGPLHLVRKECFAKLQREGVGGYGSGERKITMTAEWRTAGLKGPFERQMRALGEAQSDWLSLFDCSSLCSLTPYFHTLWKGHAETPVIRSECVAGSLRSTKIGASDQRTAGWRDRETFGFKVSDFQDIAVIADTIGVFL